MAIDYETLASGAGGALLFVAAIIKGKGYAFLNAEANLLFNELKAAVGNISIQEIADVIMTAQAYSQDGYTDAELLALGKKLVDAAKDGIAAEALAAGIKPK